MRRVLQVLILSLLFAGCVTMVRNDPLESAEEVRMLESIYQSCVQQILTDGRTQPPVCREIVDGTADPGKALSDAILSDFSLANKGRPIEYKTAGGRSYSGLMKKQARDFLAGKIDLRQMNESIHNDALRLSIFYRYTATWLAQRVQQRSNRVEDFENLPSGSSTAGDLIFVCGSKGLNPDFVTGNCVARSGHQINPFELYEPFQTPLPTPSPSELIQRCAGRAVDFVTGRCM